ncbi:MAG: tetratricopeptide repeat protein, partial [Acidobacteriota bacterium]
AGHATLGILLAQKAEQPVELERAISHLKKGQTAVPEGGQARFQLAQALLRLGRGDEAWTVMDALVSERPDDPRILLMAGQALRQSGKTEQALEYLRRAAATPEARQRATLEIVETLAAAGRNKEAADALGAFLQTDGATLTGLSRWATLLARAGDRAKAREVLDDVLAKDATFRDAIMLKALLEAADGDTEAAERMYRRALALDKDDLDAALGLARLLTELRRLPEAREILDELWAKVSKLQPRNVGGEVEVAQERAAVELLDRSLDAAQRWLSRLTVQPLDRRSLALWAESFRLRKAWREGLAWLQAESTRLEADPPTRRLYTSLVGEYRMATGDAAGAREALAPLFEGDEDEVVSALGALERGKHYDELVEQSRKALARLVEAPDVEFILAAGLERAGSFDEAVAAFRKLIGKDRENASAHNYLGYMFADKNMNLGEAKTLIERAIELEPLSGAYLDSLGWVHFRLGDLDLAERHLNRAMQLEPHDPTIHEHLAEVHLARGRTEQAVAAFRRALALEPEEPGQKERIESRLETLAADGKR